MEAAQNGPSSIAAGHVGYSELSLGTWEGHEMPVLVTLPTPRSAGSGTQHPYLSTLWVRAKQINLSLYR